MRIRAVVPAAVVAGLLSLVFAFPVFATTVPTPFSKDESDHFGSPGSFGDDASWREGATECCGSGLQLWDEEDHFSDTRGEKLDFGKWTHDGEDRDWKSWGHDWDHDKDHDWDHDDGEGCFHKKGGSHCGHEKPPPGVVPLPAAAWLLATGFVGFVALGRRRRPPGAGSA